MDGKQAGQCGILACLGVIEVPSIRAGSVFWSSELSHLGGFDGHLMEVSVARSVTC